VVGDEQTIRACTIPGSTILSMPGCGKG